VIRCDYWGADGVCKKRALYQCTLNSESVGVVCRQHKRDMKRLGCKVERMKRQKAIRTAQKPVKTLPGTPNGSKTHK